MNPELASPPEAAPDQPAAAGRTWEDDETRAGLVLRSLVTLLTGSYLGWSVWMAPIDPGQQWSRWIGASIIAYFVLPLGIVWMFFGQGLAHLSWLKDQRHNAWNYGWNFKDWRGHLKWSLGMFLLMLPLLWIFSRDAEARLYYHNFLPPVTDARSLLWLIGTLTIYLLCWEWFQRGFLLFGMAQGLGPVAAILLQAVVFGLLHWGKPRPEMWSAFGGGLVLGTVSWRARSFAPAFYTHLLVHLAWVVLVLF